MPRKTRIALLGYYGRYNFGDDLMIHALCRKMATEARDIRVFSGAPYLAGILPEPISVLPRKPLTFLATLLWCDEFVMAGGTIFHDSYQPDIRRGYIRHLWAYAFLLILARSLGKTVRLIGAGIGPLRTRGARTPSRLALRMARRIHVRDRASAAEVEALVPEAAGKLVQGSDLAFLAADGLAQAGRTTPAENRLGLSLLDMGQFLEPEQAIPFWTGLAEAVSGAMQADTSLHLTLFCYWTAPGRPNDFDPAQAFMAQLPETCRDRIRLAAYDRDIDAIIRETALCRGLIATRFHAAVISWLVGRPTAVVCYNRKVADFAEQVGLPGSWRLSGEHPPDAETCRQILTRLLAPAQPGSPPKPAGTPADATLDLALETG